MKVLCVCKDQPAGNDPDLIAAAAKLTVGEIYTVIFEQDDHYELEEFPHLGHIMWRKRCFSPLSDIDETTFERNYKKELV